MESFSLSLSLIVEIKFCIYIYVFEKIKIYKNSLNIYKYSRLENN